jgi:DNA-binding MarR family transcriptional regulator
MRSPPVKPAVPPAVERMTRRLFTEILAALSRALRDEGLTIAQIAALHLVDRDGELRPAAISDALALSASAVSRLVDDLARRELIERVEDPDDRRARLLRPTSRGVELVARVSRERVDLIVATMSRYAPASVVRLVFAAMERGDRHLARREG